jgi:hypothetical protein
MLGVWSGAEGGTVVSRTCVDIGREMADALFEGDTRVTLSKSEAEHLLQAAALKGYELCAAMVQDALAEQGST